MAKVSNNEVKVYASSCCEPEAQASDYLKYLDRIGILYFFG